jgi:glycosyltransferase involved in cell wall biosynthesis
MMVIARHLPSDRFRLTICSLRAAGFNETAPLLEKLGIPCFVAPFRPTGRKVRDALASVRSYAEIDRHGPFQIQHSLDFTTSPFESVMVRCRKRKYIFSQRNLNQDGHPWFLRVKIRLSTNVIAISGVVEDFVKSLGAPRDQVWRIYNGLDWAANRNSTPVRDPYSILNVAHIQRWKRQHIAIKAFAAIAREFESARLILAGGVFDPGYEVEIRSLAAGLPVADRITFLGTYPDVPALMQSCGVLVACSISEGVSWSILEAMRSTLPVVASDIPPNTEIVQHRRNGLLAPVDDVDGFASALREVLSNPAAAQARAKVAFDKVSTEFTPEQMISQLEKLYVVAAQS